MFSIDEEDDHIVLIVLGIQIKFRKTYFMLKFLKFNIYKWLFGSQKGNKLYLSKYLYIRKIVKEKFELIPKDEIDKQSEYVWTMWLQENPPKIIELCLDSIKKIYPNVIIITEKNIFNYIEIPDIIYKKYKAGIIEPWHFSDYIRLCLLDKYGGTWIDGSCLMLKNVPDFITKQPFFVLQNPSSKDISNFFLHSAKNNYFTKTIKTFLEEYWKKENAAIDYFFFHIFVQIIRKKCKICKNIWDNIIPYPNSIVRYFTDNINLNYDEEAWNYLSKSCFMYKLQRKKIQAVNNPQSWYNFFINKEDSILSDIK